MIVVDTSAVMAVLLNEPTSGAVIQCLADNELCMSAGTLSELLIVTATRELSAEADELLEAIGAEIKIVDGLIAKGVQQAYQKWGKGRHKASLNFGDCFAYATAKAGEMPLLFVGDDFTHTDLEPAIQNGYVDKKLLCQPFILK